MHSDPVTVVIALKYMLFGVSGVFLVLAVFYLMIKLLLKIFPAK